MHCRVGKFPKHEIAAATSHAGADQQVGRSSGEHRGINVIQLSAQLLQRMRVGAVPSIQQSAVVCQVIDDEAELQPCSTRSAVGTIDGCGRKGVVEPFAGSDYRNPNRLRSVVTRMVA